MTNLRAGGARTTTAYTTGGVERTRVAPAASPPTHPCKKRKDGAPSVGMVHAKMGHPPDYYQVVELAVEGGADVTDSVLSVDLMQCTGDGMKVLHNIYQVGGVGKL